jgi:CDP-diacylglycerol--serine O-phosphatidyltransferase
MPPKDISHKRKMKSSTLLPNMITAFGLSCGLFVIFKMATLPFAQVNLHVLMVTTGFLLLAAIADILDGAVARAMKGESEFGGMFDSLADAISFGVAPAVIVLKSLPPTQGVDLPLLITIAAMVYSLCGILRLVRFNVAAHKAKSDETLAQAHKKHFTGLPIPAAATAAVSLNLLMASQEFTRWFHLSTQTREWIMCFAMLVLGYLMVSRWKFFSLKSLRIRIASFRLVFVTVLLAVLFFFSVLNHFPVFFFIASWSYVIVAWLLSVIRVISGKRLKTLEEFEPDPNDDLID